MVFCIALLATVNFLARNAPSVAMLLQEHTLYWKEKRYTQLALSVLYAPMRLRAVIT